MKKATLSQAITTHTTLLVYAAGSVLITMWTMLRFFTQHTIFDVVGQQVMVQQWLHGSLGLVDIGVTNYLLKMLFLYVPLELVPGSPRLKLILLTIVVNIATFILLGVVLEKILRLFDVKRSSSLSIGLVWLAAIAGSVYWIQFTNSRNLEVVGGVFLIYQGLCFIKHPTRRRFMAVTTFATVLFFSDPLQLYMTAAPLLVYVGVLAFKQRKNQQQLLGVVYLAGSLLLGYIGSKLLFILAGHIFKLHYLGAAGGSSISIATLTDSISGTAKAIVHLYAGATDAGKLREIGNILFAGLLLVGMWYAVIRRLISRRLVLLVGCILLVDVTAYILSGQAQHPETERYLIMTVPAVILLIGGCYRLWPMFKTTILTTTSLLVVLNVVTLGTTLSHANKHFAPDQHLASVGRFVANHPTLLPFSSMDTSLPLAYLSGSDTRAPLPLSCSNNYLTKNKTFYTTKAFNRHLSGTYQFSAIILDGTAIHNAPSVCTNAAIMLEFGQPSATMTTDDGSLVLLYPPNLSERLSY